MTEPILKCDNIGKTFPSPSGEVTAVSGASLEAGAGEFIGLFGASGCGKSTLLLVAGGLMEPSSGSVQVCGKNPYSLDPAARAAFRAENIGFLFQQFHLVPYLSVLENVLAPTLATNVPDAETRADELLQKFSLGHRTSHRPSQLSTGEQQRVAFVRAILTQPKLLIADEPTGNLDAENSQAILDYIDGFVKEGGTAVMATHDPAALERTQRSVKLG